MLLHPPSGGPPATTMSSLDEKSPNMSAEKVDADAYDVEVQSSQARPEEQLKRQLKDRHIAMISIGGVIGTGLFVGTANALTNAGPIGLLLGYIVTGSLCYTMMISLGEMVSYLPIAGGHITLAGRFVDPAFSFTLGWMYWYNWVLVLPAELSAVGVLMQYWHPPVTGAVWIVVCLVVVITINLFGAGVYGECEFIFASIKIIAIVGLIILGIILDLGGVTGDRLGFRYWLDPGPFVQFNGISGSWGRFLGFWRTLIVSAGAYIGTEIVAIAAAETKNPRRNLPRAIKRIYIRIILFYICGVIIVGLLVPSNDPRVNLGGSDASASPFVIAIERAGIKALPSIINAVLVSAAWSAASSDLYTSSRALYGLAAAGNAPKIFLRTTKHGLPWVSVGFCAMFSALAFMTLSTSAGQVFTWFQNLCGVAGLLTWFGSSITYIRFYNGMKAQGIDRSTLPYRSPFQPYAAYYAAALSGVIVLFSGWTTFLHGNWDTATFVTNYFGLAAFPIMFIGAKLWRRTKFVGVHEMDFTTGLKEIDEADVLMEPPKTWIGRVWRALM
ncbi:putative general amino acid permease [Cylindrobasidium torrendii FP15055 ss-10]|uniref:Putative general amino acid permease n=1 Tax=Cylindrobasidium torrendii FP15055 ss-10 TaxID=1314674 RepID=A0A0D7B8I7_9AGAR|nr:putative general amino acid permease [Cylindrobasidium torrendii FP15055 ss-10]